MLKARRLPLLPLLVFALVQVGCAPARHAVRVQAADGQVRVTAPPPRPPLALPKEEVRKAVRALAQQVVPVADRVEFARVQFGVPVLEGVYILNARTKELKPADKATEASEEPPPELILQTQDYLNYCGVALHQPGDCFGALHGHRYLDAHGRYMVAMGIAIAGTFEATGESLKDMLSVKEVLGIAPWSVLEGKGLRARSSCSSGATRHGRPQWTSSKLKCASRSTPARGAAQTFGVWLCTATGASSQNGYERRPTRSSGRFRRERLATNDGRPEDMASRYRGAGGLELPAHGSK